MMWQKRTMKGMNGDWMMVLHYRVSQVRKAREGENEPVDVCLEEDRLPSRLANHGDALVVFLQRFSGGIDALLTESRCRRLLGRYAPVDEREHAKTDDLVGMPCDLVEFVSHHLPVGRLVTVLQPRWLVLVSCLKGEISSIQLTWTSRVCRMSVFNSAPRARARDVRMCGGCMRAPGL